ncbi:MAG: ISAs1 family transposase [Nostoc sp.]
MTMRSLLKQTKRACIAKFNILRIIPSQPVGTSQQKELETDLQHARSVVFDDLTGISQEWTGLKSLIKVERIGTRAGKPYQQVAYYISSLVKSAVDFAKGIRGHWGIENRLHWVKDVIFNEDHSTIRKGNAPANLSVLRTFALNILRRNGYSSITLAQRFTSNDIDKLLSFVE